MSTSAPDESTGRSESSMISRSCCVRENGDSCALDELIRRYSAFVRMKSSKLLPRRRRRRGPPARGPGRALQGDARLPARSRSRSFRSFAELCITRQIITAIKSATRYKHSPLNGYVSFSQTPAGHDEAMDCTLGDSLPGPTVDDPSRRVIATQELGELICVLGTALSRLESQVLTLYLEGRSYEEIGAHVECDPKAVDNALQRVKRKVGIHLGERAVLDAD